MWGETPSQGEMFHCGDAYATVVSGKAGCRGVGWGWAGLEALG